MIWQIPTTREFLNFSHWYLENNKIYILTKPAVVSYLKSNLLLLIDTLLLVVELFSNYKIYFEKNCISSIIQNLLSSAGTASLEDPTMSSFTWYKNVLNILLSAMLENQTLSFGKPKTRSTDFPQGFPTWVQLQHPRFFILGMTVFIFANGKVIYNQLHHRVTTLDLWSLKLVRSLSPYVGDSSIFRSLILRVLGSMILFLKTLDNTRYFRVESVWLPVIQWGLAIPNHMPSC